MCVAVFYYPTCVTAFYYPSKSTWCLTSTETIRLIREGGLEEGEEGDYTNHYTVTTRMTPALRWAVMRAILMFH